MSVLCEWLGPHFLHYSLFFSSFSFDPCLVDDPYDYCAFPCSISSCIIKWHVNSTTSFCRTCSLFFTTQRRDCAPCTRRQSKVEYAPIDEWEYRLLESGCLVCSLRIEGIWVRSEQLLGHDKRWEDALFVEGVFVLLRRHKKDSSNLWLLWHSQMH